MILTTALAGTSPVQRRNDRPSIAWLSDGASPGPEALAPGCRVEVVPNAGHFPHKDHPQRFVKIVQSFLRTTQPALYDRDRLRSLLEHGGDVPVQHAPAGHGPVAPLRTLSGA